MRVRSLIPLVFSIVLISCVQGQAYLDCDMVLKVTSANVSNTKIIVGSQDYLRQKIAELEENDKNFFLDGLDQKLELSDMNFKQTSSSQDISMGFSQAASFKVTSVHASSYRLFGADSLNYKVTSQKSDKLKLLSHNTLNVQTTNYDIDDALLMLVTDDNEIKVCIKETSAGSLDLDILGAENATVKVVSVATSFKNTTIRSIVKGASIVD